MKLIQQLQTHLKQTQLIQPQDHLLLAVSTGADSMAMLDMFVHLSASMNLTIGVAHVNHQLRSASDQEASYLAQYCEQLALPFYQTIWDQQQQPDAGIEAAARDFRYDFFERIADAHHYQKVLTAHHGDDQLENLLMGIVRSGNLNEISSLQAKRQLNESSQVQLIRPMLPFSKLELLAYIEGAHIQYFEDETNLTDQTLRNRIRHHVIPLLKQESTQILSHTQRFYDELNGTKGLAKQTITQAINQLQLEGLAGHHNGWQGQWGLLSVYTLSERTLILQEIAKKKRIVISRRQLAQINQLLENSQKPQGEVALQHHWSFVKQYDLFKLIKRPVHSSPLIFQPIKLKAGQHYDLPDKVHHLVLQARTEIIGDSSTNLVLRVKQPGDEIELRNGQHQKLKDYLINHKISKDVRDLLLVVAAGNQVLWVLDSQNSQLLIKPQTAKMNYIIRIRGEHDQSC